MVLAQPVPMMPSSHSASNVLVPSRRVPPASRSSNSLAFPQSATVNNLTSHGTQKCSSRTWTTSSGEVGLMSDTDELEDRASFVQGYNRLAKKHGVRILVVDDFKFQHQEKAPQTPGKRSWLSRFLRSTSTGAPNAPLKSGTKQPPPKHRRSVSDIAHNLVSSRHGPPKTLDLQAMVRLNGKSALYLPHDHTPGSLVLPTCIRATAQHLAQNTTASGVFRIPGSVKAVNALFNYYCHMGDGGADIASTVRCANLPVHINASVHDVGSTFKRLLSVLPGGILGTLSIFDAFVAINSHLQGQPEFPRTKQTKVRARLIALAIATIESQFRRELICAVFGLLSLIGRAAEVAPREDENGRPLPTGDLMGYSALGIVFGPLLVGDLLNQYNMNLATPASGLLLLPVTPKKLHKGQKGRGKLMATEKISNEPASIDKVHVANNVTEMLIANWRDVVRQMKSLGMHHRKVTSSLYVRTGSLRPSISEPFVIKKPQGWDYASRESAVQVNRDRSPEPETLTMGIQRQRPRSKKSASSNRLRGKPSGTLLSPTAEEGSAEGPPFQDNGRSGFLVSSPVPGGSHLLEPFNRDSRDRGQDNACLDEDSEVPEKEQHMGQRIDGARRENTTYRSPEVSKEDVPPRTSSKQRPYVDKSVIPPPIQALGSGGTAHGLPASDRPSGVSKNEQLRQNPRVSQPQEWSFDNNEVSPTDVQIPCPETARRRGSQISQGSRSSYYSAHKSVEARIEAEKGEISPGAFEAMTALPKEFTEGHRMEDTRNKGSRAETLSSIRGGGSQTQEKEIFYPPPTGKVKSHVSPPLSIARQLPVDTTPTAPKSFYAPMMVPPGLLGAHGDNQVARLGRRKVSAGDSGDETLRAEDGDTSGGDCLLENHEKHKKLSKVATNAESQSFLSKQLNRSDATSAAIPGTLRTLPSSNVESRVSSVQKTAEKTPFHTSDSDPGSRRVGVRAMAAMFEDQEDIKDAASSQQKLGGRGSSSAIQSVHSSPNKTIPTPKSGSFWEEQFPPKTDWDPKHLAYPSKASLISLNRNESSTKPILRKSASDSVALRAAAIMEAENQHMSGRRKRPPLVGLRQTTALPKAIVADSSDENQNQKQGAFNLGTMVPHPEQPPIAQHLNLARPPSSASGRLIQGEDASAQDAPTPTPRPGSTTFLHAQIRSLQRQLDVKTEEAAQLRRQLEAQENSDVGTLSEQMREAKREVQMWKERAEAAERRVKVFERFTARLKGIREAAAVADQQGGHPAEKRDLGTSPDGSSDGDGELNPKQQVKFLEGRQAGRRRVSDGSGHTEDAGVVTARIRKCLHGSHASTDSPAAQDGAADDWCPRESRWGVDNVASPPDSSRGANLGATEIWMAAQEILHLG